MSSPSPGGGDAGPATGLDAITGFLAERGVRYEVVEHEPTYSAGEEAHAAHLPPDRVAKTVVVHDGERYVLAAVPASERLDMHKLRELLGAGKGLRLASEAEIGEHFPGFIVGALPPFGGMVGVETVVDRRLLELDSVLCAAGDHQHAVRVDPGELARAMDVTQADLCAD
jgi:Ala-tRNA(Pro) deacylase